MTTLRKFRYWWRLRFCRPHEKDDGTLCASCAAFYLAGALRRTRRECGNKAHVTHLMLGQMICLLCEQVEHRLGSGEEKAPLAARVEPMEFAVAEVLDKFDATSLEGIYTLGSLVIRAILAEDALV